MAYIRQNIIAHDSDILTHNTLEYIGPSTVHNFVKLIPDVTTSSSNDLLAYLFHPNEKVLYECLWCVSPFLNQGTAAALEGYEELLAAISQVG